MPSARTSTEDRRMGRFRRMLAIVSVAACSMPGTTGAATVVAQGGVYEVVAPDTTAGSGEMSGGAYRATVTIASHEGPAPMTGGAYAVTGGLERARPDTRGSEIFADGFE